MQITKYIHSCLLFEQNNQKLLFDPGKFSFVEGRVSPDLFKDVSTVVISHSHPDHVEPEVLKQIIDQSGATLVANSQVGETLAEKGLHATILENGSQQFGPFNLQAIPAQHAAILSDELPTNTAFLINERVLNPSDSFNATLAQYAGIELLILPVTAPWQTELAVADFVKQMKPQQILPVHDGYVKEFFRKQRYDNYSAYFQKMGIQFHAIAELGGSVSL